MPDAPFFVRIQIVINLVSVSQVNKRPFHHGHHYLKPHSFAICRMQSSFVPVQLVEV